MSNVIFPHTTNSTAAVQKYEAVVASNFNAHFVLMGNLSTILGNYNHLSEYIKSVNGLFIEKSGGVLEAGYKTVKFRYDSNEKETFYDVEIAFHNFLDKDSRMFIYNSLVAWSRVKFNPLTGERGLKKDYANACIVVEKFNRDGTIFWRRVGHNAFPMNELEDQSADYSNHEMAELACTFAVDYVTDVTNDPRLV